MASEEDVLLREVDEDLSRDQNLERLRKYQVPLIAGAVAIIGGVAGYQFYDTRSAARAADAAETYAELTIESEAAPAADRLRAFAREHEGGYGVLASLRAAASLASEGDLEGARDLYATVYNDDAASSAMRDFARLRAGYLLFDERPDEAAEIAGLVETEAFRPHAEELASAAALTAGSYEAAKAGFEALAASEEAPASLRARAESYAALADAGAAGASFEKQAMPENPASFIERFGAELEAAGLPVNDAGPVMPDLPDAEGGAAATPQPGQTETETEDGPQEAPQ